MTDIAQEIEFFASDYCLYFELFTAAAGGPSDALRVVSLDDENYHRWLSFVCR